MDLPLPLPLFTFLGPELRVPDNKTTRFLAVKLLLYPPNIHHTRAANLAMDTITSMASKATSKTSEAATSATGVETRAPRAFHVMSTNEGPADIIAKVSGKVSGGKREDDGPYFTNNEGIPLPDQ